MSYAGLLEELIDTVAPWWVRGPFLRAHGFILDTMLAQFRIGMRSLNPLTCDASALPSVAAAFKMSLYSTASEASSRLRLSQRWQIKKRFGSHKAELLNLQGYFAPGPLPRCMAVFQDGIGASATWCILEPDGTYWVHRAHPSNWNWDGSLSKWARFWVIVDLSTIGATPVGQWNDGTTEWDGTGPSYWGAIQAPNGLYAEANYSDMIGHVLEAQAAHSLFMGLIFNYTPGLFTPGGSGANYPSGNWNWIVDPVSGLRTRADGAVYLDCPYG